MRPANSLDQLFNRISVHTINIVSDITAPTTADTKTFNTSWTSAYVNWIQKRWNILRLIYETEPKADQIWHLPRMYSSQSRILSEL